MSNNFDDSESGGDHFMTETVIQYILRRLNEIGVDDVFGFAGDYAFPVNDAIVENPAISWIGCSNELNAAYAADGYARMRGVGAVCSTFGVGELAAMSAIAGAYAEHVPVFHLVGTPNLPTLVHHTLGNGKFRPVPPDGRAHRVRKRNHDATERGSGNRTADRRGALPSTAGVHGNSTRRGERTGPCGRASAEPA
jgi:Thiamine pyrophosphate enzyme, N-terminal TPP binding domain